MAYNSTYDLLGKKVSDTYPSLLQSGSDGVYYDGRGNSVLLNAANGGVTQITAGGGIVISPSNGVGNVTVNATAATYNTATGSYGSFYSTGSQTAVLASQIYSMSLSTTDISNGVYISGSGDPYNTFVKFTNTGTYNVQFSAQFSNSGNNPTDVFIWLRKNDASSVNDLADSSGVCTVPAKKGSTNGQLIASWNYLINVVAGDFIQLLWHTADANVITLETIAAGTNPTHPRTPALILTAQRVDTFLSNTGSFSGSFTGEFTGSLLGTGSWANNAVTASYILNAVSSSFASTASYADTLDGIDSTQFARVDVDNTFNGVNTVTQKTLRDNSGYIIAETSISSDEIVGPDTQSVEVFNVYQYVTYTTDRSALNTAATFDYTIFDNTLLAIRSGRVNLSWTPNTPGQEAITDTQTIVDPAESANITLSPSVDYSIGTEFVKLNVLNGASKPIYIRGFLRII